MSTGNYLPIYLNPELHPSKVDDSQNLDVIKEKIVQYQKDCEQCYLEIGHLLIQAKTHFGKHGDWLKWLRSNVDMSVCKAQRLMRVAAWTDEKEALVPHLGFTKAYILCKLSRKELDEFLKSINGAENIKRMTKRELETAVQKYVDLRKSKNDTKSTSKVKNSAEEKLAQRFDKLREDIKNLAADIIQRGGDSCDLYGKSLVELCAEIVEKFPVGDIEGS